jgi:hypothetical protein
MWHPFLAKLVWWHSTGLSLKRIRRSRKELTKSKVITVNNLEEFMESILGIKNDRQSSDIDEK